MPTTLEEYLAARVAIKAAIVALVESLDTKAIVLPTFTFDESDDNWPALLRSPDDLDDDGKPKIHAIQIFYAGARQEKRGATPAGLMLPILPIGFGFFRLYEIGVSEEELDAEVATVQMEIAKAQTFEGAHFDGLVVPNYRLTRGLSGTGQIQYGLGVMEIEMQGVQLR
jgi:hypothetical protein